MFPLVYAGDVPNTADGYNSSTSRYQNMNRYVLPIYFLRKKYGFEFRILLIRFCFDNSVDKHLVKGKIVLCDGFGSPDGVGAAGMLFGSTDAKDAPPTYALPAAFISLRNFELVRSYMISSRYSFICSYLYFFFLASIHILLEVFSNLIQNGLTYLKE